MGMHKVFRTIPLHLSAMKGTRPWDASKPYATFHFELGGSSQTKAGEITKIICISSYLSKMSISNASPKVFEK